METEDGTKQSLDNLDTLLPDLHISSPEDTPSPPAFRFDESRCLDPSNAKTRPSPVWAVDYDHSRLIHSPTFLSFLPYYDTNGDPLQVLPPAKSHSSTAPDSELAEQMSVNGTPAAGDGPRRRLPCYNQVADAYVFQQTIDERLRRIGVSQTREDNLRLAGAQWIDSVRRALKLPVRTFDTAIIYYHKFRLVHSDGEYSFSDAAAAALFAACKIEDTLKKSRDILCASHNLKVPRQDQLSPDDPIFESHSRTIIGLERLMLEAAGFDFRSRHPQTLLVKFLKYYGHARDSLVSRLAFKISLDLYRTFAPLKQCSATMAFACIELATRLDQELQKQEDQQQESASEEQTSTSSNSRLQPNPSNNGQNHDRQQTSMSQDYDKWRITRAQVMETLLDLLDLYIHYRASTAIGPTTPLDAFLQVRIPLNEEMDRKKLPRYTEYVDIHPPTSVDQGRYDSNLPASSHHTHNRNGTGISSSRHSSKTTSPRDAWIPSGPGGKDLTSPSTASSGAPGSGSTNATSTTTAAATTGNHGTGHGVLLVERMGNAGVAGPREGNQPGIRQRIGERGRDGTVRFMLNPDREREERAVVAEYARDEGGGGGRG